MVKTSFVLVFLAFIALQINGAEERWSLFSAILGNTSNIYQQADTLIKDLNSLVNNNILGNTQASLTLAKQNLNKAENATKANQTTVIRWLNQTIGILQNSTANLQVIANIQGINLTNCTQGATHNITDLPGSYITSLVNCPINEAAKGLSLINNAIEYVSNLTNMTTSLPIQVNKCRSKMNSARCLVKLVSKYSVAVSAAPAKLSSMVVAANTYVNLYPTNVALCATNSSLAAIAQTTAISAEATSCVADQMPGQSTTDGQEKILLD